MRDEQHSDADGRADRRSAGAAISISPSTSSRRLRAGRNPGSRRTSQAPTTGPAVFPAARAIAAPGEIGHRKLTRNAPAAMAGHTRYPTSSKAAIAIPAGGQTGDTFPLVNGIARPTFPATKYAANTIVSSSEFLQRKMRVAGGCFREHSLMQPVRQQHGEALQSSYLYIYVDLPTREPQVHAA